MDGNICHFGCFWLYVSMCIFLSLWFYLYVSKTHASNMIFITFCLLCGAYLCFNCYGLYKVMFFNFTTSFYTQKSMFWKIMFLCIFLFLSSLCFVHVLLFFIIRFNFDKHVSMMFCKIFSINYKRCLCNIANKQCRV